MKTTKRGGARSNAGRKPVTDPKKGITIYLHQSEIDGNGGVEHVKVFALRYLKNRVKRLSELERVGQIKRNGI